MEDSAAAALAQATRPWWPRAGSLLPFVPIALGGDDVLLITTAQSAMPVASQLCLSFQQQIRERSADARRQGELRLAAEHLDIAVSAGVVIAKASHPIFALRRLAEELLRSAKQLSSQLKRRGHGMVSTLDFRVISSPSANPLEEVRNLEYRLPDAPGMGESWGTCRPYPCQPVPGLSRPAWLDLQAAMQLLKGFPRNKLQAWQELLYTDPPLNAELELSLMLAHMQPKQQIQFRQVARSLGLPNERDLFLQDVLAEHASRRFSPLPDLVELSEFIPR